MKIHHLDHLAITTADLELCLHFYVDILGMEPDLSNGRCALKFGNQKINVHRRKEEFLPAARHVTYGSQDFCLIVEGDDIYAIKAELEAKDCTVELGVVPRMGACGLMDSLYLRDADENLVEISVYRRENG